jgi:three-Cys-motif partner protein
MQELPLRSEEPGELLPAQKLPLYQSHSGAKHRLLRLYLNAWLPILGSRYRGVALVDGFASSGRYATGEPGSPLIMLEAYLGRGDRDRLVATPHYFFIEEKRKFVRHLTAEVEGISLGAVEVDILKGEYAARFADVVDRLVALGSPPTFAFVDPYGYSDNPFTWPGSSRPGRPRTH